MARQYELSQVTVNQLAQLTGERNDTIKRRLFSFPPITAVKQNGRMLFPSRSALDRVLGQNSTLPSAARARRDKADAELKELELKVRMGELIPRSEPARGYMALATGFSARIQAIPIKIAREIAAETKPAVCEQILRRELHEALSDITDAADRAMAELEAEEAEKAEKGQG